MNCLDWVGLWVCLWGSTLISLTTLIKVGKTDHCGRHITSALGTLDYVEWEKLPASMHLVIHCSMLLTVDITYPAALSSCYIE